MVFLKLVEKCFCHRSYFIFSHLLSVSSAHLLQAGAWKKCRLSYDNIITALIDLINFVLRFLNGIALKPKGCFVTMVLLIFVLVYVDFNH